mmetsp:Transcript_34777/g.64377  ORF Transcript_34777/g.64377 Transcript_34777/m.64377 type:complete len:165 (+) Transcript_34777:104-598(+)
MPTANREVKSNRSNDDPRQYPAIRDAAAPHPPPISSHEPPPPPEIGDQITNVTCPFCSTSLSFPIESTHRVLFDHVKHLCRAVQRNPELSTGSLNRAQATTSVAQRGGNRDLKTNLAALNLEVNIRRRKLVTFRACRYVGTSWRRSSLCNKKRTLGSIPNAASR